MLHRCFIALACALAFGHIGAHAQTAAPTPTPTPTGPPAATQATPPRTISFDLSEYGVRVAPEPRLIVVLAALEAAGFDPTPGRAPSVFRQQVQREQANLDPDLRQRMRRFFELNLLKGAQVTPAEQAARYVSLALALGPAPTFEPPPRTDDLFPGVLDVLDFAPFVREFYRKAGLAARLPEYIKAYQTEGDRLRRPTAEMMRTTLSFLHTRPILTVTERIPITPSAAQKKRGVQQVFSTRERERRFQLVPDLLAVPGAINFRIVGDDYFAIVPPNTDPRSSELRRAYLQFLIDPLVLRYNREVALRRADLRTLLDAATPVAAAPVAPDAVVPRPATLDVFTAVARSLVAAADAQLNATARLQALAEQTNARQQRATPAERAQLAQTLQAERAAVADEQTAQLADAYERGAVLAFYFADQLREQETAGFDIADLFADLINRFDVAREQARPREYAAARARVLTARRLAQQQAATAEDEPTRVRRAALIKSLDEAEQLMRLKQYDEAETRLKNLMPQYQGEPRVFYALAQVASNSAQEAFDEELRAQRLGRALANYRFAVEHAALDLPADRALASRAHVAMGRILAFLERTDEARQEFDAALQLGDVADGAYKEAQTAKSRLPPQP